VDSVLLERIGPYSVSPRRTSFSSIPSGLAFPLRRRRISSGVFPLSPRLQNSVKHCAAMWPRRAGICGTRAMRISDLIPARDFLINRNTGTRQNHLTPQRAGNPFASTPEPGTADQPGIVDAPRNSDEINWNYAAVQRPQWQRPEDRPAAFNLSGRIGTSIMPRFASVTTGELKPGTTVVYQSPRRRYSDAGGESCHFCAHRGKRSCARASIASSLERPFGTWWSARAGLMPKAYLYASPAHTGIGAPRPGVGVAALR